MNPVEHLWAPCTKALTSVYLPSTLPGEDQPPCRQRITEQEKMQKEHTIFDAAMRDIRDVHWRHLSFSGKRVLVIAEPSGGEQQPYGADYYYVKATIGGSARTLGGSTIDEEYTFIHPHMDRRHPPSMTEFFLPSSFTSTQGHFVTFAEDLQVNSVPPCQHMPLFQEKGLGWCNRDGCRYVFTSKKDVNDHRLKFHTFGFSPTN
ncbi:uncharacterized protein [Diadema antillarum]|uniref:uncharacterized protein n=1 Tax=Diadema antillarum TaxID=105358 RepID=UPI003A8938ED